MFREVLIKPWIKKEYIWLILDSPEDYLWIITRHRDFLKLNSLKNCIAWSASWAISSCTILDPSCTILAETITPTTNQPIAYSILEKK